MAMLLLGPTVPWAQQNGAATQPSSTAGASNAASTTAPAKASSKSAEKKQGQADKGASNAPAAQGPSTADADPFPEAQSKAAAQPKAPPAKPNPTAGDNPFPEAQSAAAAKAGGADQGPPVSKQPLHLLPPPGVSSSNENLPPEDLGETTKRHEREDTYTEDLNPEGRIKNDLKVADFYMKNWNYRGAALRYKDAMGFDPYNETALFGLAQAYCMQNMTDQALAQFKLYIQQYPRGEHVKEAEKMLRGPKKCADNH
ncbi:MAG: tetratricopeptide repeat protein [Acidobacteriaceae bacterium]